MGLDFRELLVILVIVLIVFGTKKLKNIGGDLGGAIRSFRKSMNEPDEEKTADKAGPIEGEVVPDKKDQA